MAIERKTRSVVSAIAGVNAEEHIKGQESTETLEGGKYMPEPPKEEKLNKKKEPVESKRRGRKPLQNREKRARYSFTILPSVYEKALEKAMDEGKALSELISDFLINYIG